MRAAFSTLGCPGAPVEQVIAYGFPGVELRCATGELLPPDASDRTARRVGSRLAEAGVQVVCLATYVQAGIPDDGVEESLARHIELADQVGASFVRVFGGEPGDPGVAARAAARLAACVPAAQEAGVTVLLETHDAFLTGRAVAGVLDLVASPSVGALWDVVNPWRAGEPLADTADLLRPWLRHAQVKDVASTGELAPVVPGTGAVPLEAFMAELGRIGYDGWVSLEWEAAWYPQAPALDEALPAFRALMRERVR
ncbi:sugar phosphate isomerase/epimerase family protein [Nonomuraea soli]|uniref:Sugar phosphate isomerase/epimerase n=1 Tax=Nonomuraea soli TaxID=1032476 RepID=A0A7W0HRC0_9ACTN|nr:sugar phosphate isomerase/epimerase family protein [Nonomuraea soli]MBA2892687.1 sugar phosphate isomerase/epimerase [Nonomuraea soli]